MCSAARKGLPDGKIALGGDEIGFLNRGHNRASPEIPADQQRFISRITSDPPKWLAGFRPVGRRLVQSTRWSAITVMSCISYRSGNNARNRAQLKDGVN
jgi:hypothetical protein